MRRFHFGLAFLVAVATFAGCADQKPPVNQVGVNVVDKSVFTGSWYYSRTVIDVDYEAAGIGTYPGDAAIDFSGAALGTMPRVRWVVDEDYLFAYRDYQLMEVDGERREEGDLGHPVAAFEIQSHFDIKRAYNPNTGENRNVVVENTSDRRWYERDFMRVDWSKNLLPAYYGQVANLYEVLGFYHREPADIYIQAQSEFPESWKPQFHHMDCAGPDDESEACTRHDRDWAADYEQGEMYSFSFVTQELMSPGSVPDPFNPGALTQWCTSIYADAPNCTTVAVYIRNSFLKVSDQREYVPQNWVDTRFDKHGYFRLERNTYDGSEGPGDPRFGQTDFLNYNINRHNIWMDWVDDETGEPVPYAEREVRPIVWYTTYELPAHLVRPAFDLVAQWNSTMMDTVRNLRGEPEASYPRVQCQTDNPDGYCYCTTDPDTGEVLLPDTDGDGTGDCRGQYDPFLTPEEAEAQGATNPYDCWIEVPEGAEPDMNDPSLTDEDFYAWYGAHMRGSECVNVLRVNTCNRRSIEENGGTKAGLSCEERGDARFKFLSYVDQPGTAFLGVATLRGDPVTGEIIVGDANIGGPALDGYRTFALQTYDIMNGNLSNFEVLTGEDVRSALESLDQIQQPNPPRIDFNVALKKDVAASWTDPVKRSIDNKMQRYYSRAQKLQDGAEGFRKMFAERRAALAGSSIERRLLENKETLMMAGIERLPEGKGPEDINDHILDKVSPFRTTAHERLSDFREIRNKVSKANMMLPNEFTDWSVMEFVNRHKDWPRARLEIEMNRMLYYETQLHEMGHCLGLRHMFGASADTKNYFDDYYYIEDSIPLPDPRDFDTDGTNGLSPEEQAAYQAEYETVKKRRELAGIDYWQNSSIMEYTAQWYERTVTRAGRYDNAAIGFGYGDLTELYDNAGGLDQSEIDPTNTDRTWAKYYHGGEVCEAGNDASCPYGAGGSHANELLQANRDAGLTQKCVSNPLADGEGPMRNGICTNFDDDLASMIEGETAPRWAPVDYRFCTDDRVGTIGWCHRFDEGDSYREIVQNIIEQYNRQYIFTNFRRYRSDFNIGSYLFNRLIGRQFQIIQDVFQNLLFNYANDPEFRTDTGDFGFYDQFMATADAVNFYARVLGQPDIGAYEWNEAWEQYQRVNRDPDSPGAQLRIPIGVGRYQSSRYQSGLTGIERIERIGSFYEKWFTMQLMTQRGWQQSYARDVPFYTNYYDLFPVEMQQIFQGMIQDLPEAYMPRIECGSGTFPRCEDPTVLFMDFYRGDCSSSSTCRPNPEENFSGLPVVDGGGSVLLQSLGVVFALTEFPVFFDTTFQNQLFICVKGQGDCHLPEEGSVEGEDYLEYTSTRYDKTFLTWQVEPTEDVPNATSIGFSMISEARDTAFIIEVLRRARGDFGTPEDPTPAEETRLADIGYEIPDGTDSRTITGEIDRLDGRLRSLESFFFQVIQLERELGVATYLGF